MGDSRESEATHDMFQSEFFKAALSNQREYDKSILTLSSGLIAAAVLFINAILSKGYCISHYGFLIVALWLWVIAIVTVLLGFQLSANNYIDALFIARNQGDFVAGKLDSRARFVEKLNYASGLFFFLGVLAFVILASLNIHY
ncbi:MAG: hypothetical protein HQ472_10395 [Ignavibacteria bacterium]|nr:hypothetical protein [Ignavibacteria bacterium]